jgi:three-Cys-motif partner protein
MTRRHYNWRNGPADIEQHSIAKHNVLRAYLARYFETLAGYPHHDTFRLTLVDGFAGGGEYVHKDTKELVLGSPFVCLEAARDAAVKLNVGRKKPFTLDVQYFFVEQDRNAHGHLEQALRARDYGAEIGQRIHLRCATFQDEAAGIISAIKTRSPRSGRSIFVLDQYGYKDVPGTLIQNIFNALPGAEIVLTFAVDSLITYANDGTITTQLLKELGLEGVFGGRTIDSIRQSEREWRLLIQSVLYRGLIERCGAKHYTPFFIRNPRGHGDYWLIHMSQHHRARDVMTEVHWGNHNHFIHYGGPGLQMFQMVGYDPDGDSTPSGQRRLGFEFDDVAREQSLAALMEQFPTKIYARHDGISFGELFTSTCNQTPATAALYRHALSNLVEEKIIIINGKDGALRRSANSIQIDDRLTAPNQRDFFI